MKTAVMFYKEKNPDNILAVFPEKFHYPHSKISLDCYSHVGQHSGAGVNYIKGLKIATKAEYSDLKTELESIGYELEILNENLH